MSLFDFIGSIFKPAADLVDNLHTSEEEKLQLNNKLVAMQNEVSMKFLEYDKKLVDAQSSIIIAEAKGDSWLQRSWRPMAMVTLLVIMVLASMGFISLEALNKLPPQYWELFKIGLGGYIVGRSTEKTAKEYFNSKK